jgi:hypothetical protein
MVLRMLSQSGEFSEFELLAKIERKEYGPNANKVTIGEKNSKISHACLPLMEQTPELGCKLLLSE